MLFFQVQFTLHDSGTVPLKLPQRKLFVSRKGLVDEEILITSGDCFFINIFQYFDIKARSVGNKNSSKFVLIQEYIPVGCATPTHWPYLVVSAGERGCTCHTHPRAMHAPCHVCTPATHTPCHATPPCEQNDRRLWKYYLAATALQVVTSCVLITMRQRSYGKVMFSFVSACQSFCPQGEPYVTITHHAFELTIQGSNSPSHTGIRPPPPSWHLLATKWFTVGTWAVCILLDCFLVYWAFFRNPVMPLRTHGQT